MLITALLGSRAAAPVAALSAVLAQRFAGVEEGEISLWIPVASAEWVGIALFSGVCATIIGLVHLLHRAMAELEVQTAKLEHLNLELESRVHARTAELEQANGDLRQEIQARELAESKVRQAQKMEGIGT